MLTAEQQSWHTAPKQSLDRVRSVMAIPTFGTSKASSSAIQNASNHQIPSSLTEKSVHSLHRRPVRRSVADLHGFAARRAFLCRTPLQTRWYHKLDCVSTRDDQVLPPLSDTLPIFMFAAAIDAPFGHKPQPQVLRLIRISLSQQLQGHSLTKLQMFSQPFFLSGYDTRASMNKMPTALCSKPYVLLCSPDHSACS